MNRKWVALMIFSGIFLIWLPTGVNATSVTTSGLIIIPPDITVNYIGDPELINGNIGRTGHEYAYELRFITEKTENWNFTFCNVKTFEKDNKTSFKSGNYSLTQKQLEDIKLVGSARFFVPLYFESLGDYSVYFKWSCKRTFIGYEEIGGITKEPPAELIFFNIKSSPDFDLIKLFKDAQLEAEKRAEDDRNVAKQGLFIGLLGVIVGILSMVATLVIGLKSRCNYKNRG